MKFPRPPTPDVSSLQDVKKRKAEIWKYKIPKKCKLNPEDSAEKPYDIDPGMVVKNIKVDELDSSREIEIIENTTDQQRKCETKKVVTVLNLEEKSNQTTVIVTPSSLTHSHTIAVKVPSTSVIKSTNHSLDRDAGIVKQNKFGYGFTHETSYKPDESYWNHQWNIIVGVIEGFRLHLESVRNPNLIKYKGEIDKIYNFSKQMKICEKNYDSLLEQYKKCLCSFNKEIKLTSQPTQNQRPSLL